jgi:hypothetical protein
MREEEEDDQLGHEGGLGQLRGRGPVVRGGGERPVEKKKMGRSWAERSDGPKVKQKFFFE